MVIAVRDTGGGGLMNDGSEPVIRTIAMPADINPAGDIFGGWLMSQMDLAAGSVATRRARGRCATVAVEGMAFHNAVLIGDEVSLFAELVSVGRSSMRIQVEAWRRPRDGEDMTRVTEARFTFVAIDEARRSRPLPD
jgi:acyl-CoA thioesterase YciA